MILTFSNPQFVTRILEGTKIHTIREDKTNRWKVGRKIQFWSGNPRNVKNKPYQFATGICTEIKEIKIDFCNEDVLIIGNKFNDIELFCSFRKLDDFAKKDGFDNWDNMKDWFYQKYPEGTVFEMKLIHFELNNF
jgi:hypothetical protein